MQFTYNEDAWAGRLITAPLYVIGFALYFLRPLGTGLMARSGDSAGRQIIETVRRNVP